MCAFTSMTGFPRLVAARFGVSNSDLPVSGAPLVFDRPNTFSWSARKSVSHDSISIRMRRATR